MKITTATAPDVEEAVGHLCAAFSEDPITLFLLEAGPGYPARLSQFFSLLMRARIALSMPVLLARGPTGIQGATMGYTTAPPDWPSDLAQDWARFGQGVPGMAERMTVYDAIAERYKPSAPHHYLGVIGVDPTAQGLGIGMQLLKAFCDLSARDPQSAGVYLETAKPANVPFYERAGFVVTGRGRLGSETLWCMFLTQRPRQAGF